jgi:hypothetical protein
MIVMNPLERPSVRVIGRQEDDDDDTDDTLELELNEAAIRALTEAALLSGAASEEQPDAGLTAGAAREPETRWFVPETPTQGRHALDSEVPGSDQGLKALDSATPAAGRPGEAFQPEAPPRKQRTLGFAPAQRKNRRFALGLGMVATAAGLLGGVAYLATAGARHTGSVPIVADSGSRPTGAREAPLSAPPSEPADLPPTSDDDPVQYKNPFDRSEVFEFPAGTTAIQARDAVAELLLQRALERKDLLVKRPRRKTTNQSASVTASRVNPRS